MSRGYLLLLIPLLLGGCDKFTGKPASFDDIVKVVEALRAAGCTGLSELKSEREGFDAEGVTCGDESYDIELDKSFAIVSKRKDRF